jgi:Holliday junction resolvase RusA-like endonuclease
MNEPHAAPAPLLRVVLPGVVSWSRPRKARGGVRYPPAYVRARDAWSLLVALAVRDAHWRPPPGARYRVAVGVAGGGRRDLDRVCTAVLDALQAGGAVRDDCLVDALTATRQAAPPRGAPATTVEVAPLQPLRRRRRPAVSGAPVGPVALASTQVGRQAGRRVLAASAAAEPRPRGRAPAPTPHGDGGRR